MKNPGTIFKEILRESLHFRWFSLNIDEKNTTKIVVRTNHALPNITKMEVRTNQALPDITKIVVRTIAVLFFSSQNRAYRHFLEPESCVPAIFSRKIVVRTMMAIPSFGHLFDRQIL